MLGEHHSEFENRSLLPVSDAIRAIGDFFDGGSRPDWIRWDENRFWPVPVTSALASVSGQASLTLPA